MSLNASSSPSRCRCCLDDKKLRDLCTDYTVDGVTENYGRMLVECFPSNCNGEVLESSHLCVSCVTRLKDAYEFRTELHQLHPLALEPDIKEETNIEADSNITPCDLDEEPIAIEVTNATNSHDSIHEDDPIKVDSELMIHPSDQDFGNTGKHILILNNTNIEANVLNQNDQITNVLEKNKTYRERRKLSSKLRNKTKVKKTAQSKKRKNSKLNMKKAMKPVKTETIPIKLTLNPKDIVIENFKLHLPESEDIILVTVGDPKSKTIEANVDNNMFLPLPCNKNLDSEIKELIPNLKSKIETEVKIKDSSKKISDPRKLKDIRESRNTEHRKQSKSKENKLESFEPETKVEVMTNDKYYTNLGLGSIPTDEEHEDVILLQIEGTENKDLILDHEDNFFKVTSYIEMEVDKNIDYLDGDEDFEKWKKVVSVDKSVNSNSKVEFHNKTENIGDDLNVDEEAVHDYGDSEFYERAAVSDVGNSKYDEKDEDDDEDPDFYEKDTVNDDEDPDFVENTADSTESTPDNSSDNCSDIESDDDNDYKPNKKSTYCKPGKRGRHKKKKSGTPGQENGGKKNKKITYTEQELKDAVQAVLSGRWSQTKALRTLKIGYRSFHAKLEETVGYSVPMREPLPDSGPFLRALAAILKHTNATPFRCSSNVIYCSYCGRSRLASSDIRSAAELRSHRPQHSRATFKDIIRCVWPVKAHEFVRLDIADLQCTVCPADLTWDELPTHLKEVHKEDISAGKTKIVPYNLTENLCNVTCVLCPETFPCLAKLELHLNEHFPNHICGECGLPFVCKSRLKTHKTSAVHRDASDKRCCDLCGKILPSQARLYNHMYSYHMLREKREKTMYQCQHCPERYNNFIAFKRHHDNMHSNSTISCEFCSEAMSQTTYKYHLNNKHKDMKASSKLFIQTIHGPKKLPIQSRARKNKLNCTICNRKYANLDHHMKITHENRSENPHNECDACGKCFSTPLGLSRHKRDLHVDEGVYFECEFCHYKFGAENYLIKHQKRKHPLQFMAKREALGNPYVYRPKKKGDKNKQK